MKTRLALFAFLLGSNAFAQEKERPMTLSLSMHAGDPVGEFDAAWGKQYMGFGGNFSVPFRRLPFEWGFQFDWSLMGSESAVVDIEDDFLQATTGDLTVRSNIYGVHALARFKPFAGKVAPYVDALGGWRTFTTRTKVRVDGVEGSYSNERNATDHAGSAGWAAGIMVQVAEGFYVEGRYEKLQGNEVTYVDPSTIAVSPDGTVNYTTATSNSDVWQVKIGVGFRF